MKFHYLKSPRKAQQEPKKSSQNPPKLLENPRKPQRSLSLSVLRVELPPPKVNYFKIFALKSPNLSQTSILHHPHLILQSTASLAPVLRGILSFWGKFSLFLGFQSMATEGEVVEKQSSYTYWVRTATEEAAPLPTPRKLTAEDISKRSLTNSNSLGSVWNQAGTWEERNLNTWASNRIKELLSSLGTLELSSGKATIDEVSKCSGDAFLVTVRNKKRVGYTYELTLKFKGEWLVKEEKKRIQGHLDIPEFSFGELDDLQVESRLSDDKDLTADEKVRIRRDLQSLVAPIRMKLQEFEQELKDR